MTSSRIYIVNGMLRKMRKEVIFKNKRILAVVTVMLVFSCVVASAATPYALGANPTLSFDDEVAECYVECRGTSTNDRIEATLTLYRGSTVIDSWSKSGKGSITISETCDVVSGVTYRLAVSWSVNGVQQNTVGTTKTCP